VDGGERVVGHQPLGDDPVICEEVQRALGERGDCRGGLVVVDLGVREPAAVVDDRVHVLPADPPRPPSAVAGDGVAGLIELAQLLGVDVQQLARARPQVADYRRALGPRATRDAGAPEHPMHRRVRPADRRLVGEPTRAPARVLTQLADPGRLLGRQWEWVGRWRGASPAERASLSCLAERSSRPHRSPAQVPHSEQACIRWGDRRTSSRRPGVTPLSGAGRVAGLAQVTWQTPRVRRARGRLRRRGGQAGG
jgi:hypothetical protein